MRKLFAFVLFAAVAHAQTITSPVSGSTLTGATVTFQWTAISGAMTYQLWLGTTGAGSSNIGIFSTTTTSYKVTTLPTTGGTVYARLYADVSGTWKASSFTYTAFNGSTPPPPSTYQVSLSCTASANSTAANPGTTVISRAPVANGVIGTYAVLTSTAPPACTYMDTTVVFGSTYEYKAEATISGVTTNCTSACTNTAQITITSAQLSPTNLVAH